MLLVVVAALFVSALLLLVILALISRSGSIPEWAGGRLPSCPETPNCVCSEYQEDGVHAVEPLTVNIGEADAVRLIGRILSQMGGEVVVQQEHYVAATFSSPLFGFIDDFELRFDPATGQLHVRSASRVGYSDGGVNRKRVNQFRQRLNAALAAG